MTFRLAVPKTQHRYLQLLFLLPLTAIAAWFWATPILAQNNSLSSTAKIAQMRSRDRAKDRATVELKLTDVVQLVIQNNRELKNSYLSRIVERQQLAEAEGKFSPTVTPNFSVSVNESLSSEPSFEDDFDGINSDFAEASVEDSREDTNFTDDLIDNFDDSDFERSLQIGVELLTPLGTNITLTTDPISDFEVIGLEVRQPLMRGAGTKVNRASVTSARLTDKRQVLELKQTLIDRITEGVKAHRSLIQAQEEVRIRQQSLASRRQDLQIQIALVKAGRRARADLVQLRSSVAAAEEQLVSAINTRTQANADLLEIIDTNLNLNIFIPQESIQALTNRNLFRPVETNRKDLLQQAYTHRPDYLQANLDVKIARLDLIEPKDNRRWQLDAVSNLNLGDSSQAIAGLELTQTLGDRSLKTAFETARVEILQRQNDLRESRETVRIEVNRQVTNVNSNLAQIEKARRAKEFAQERLRIVRELYRQGRGGVDIFEVTSQQDEVVEAQNSELNAAIDYLNARTDLQQSLGMTLNNWQKYY